MEGRERSLTSWIEQGRACTAPRHQLSVCPNYPIKRWWTRTERRQQKQIVPELSTCCALACGISTREAAGDESSGSDVSLTPRSAGLWGAGNRKPDDDQTEAISSTHVSTASDSRLAPRRAASEIVRSSSWPWCRDRIGVSKLPRVPGPVVQIRRHSELGRAGITLASTSREEGYRGNVCSVEQ